jgi:hypothetical protein
VRHATDLSLLSRPALPTLQTQASELKARQQLEAHIQIKKSRLGREGDLLMVERDINGVYSVWDHTPTERRTNEGQGDPEPSTMALRIVRDRARGEGPAEERRMTTQEVWEQLVEERTGLGLQSPSKKSVHRWLSRWVEDGVLVLGGYVMAGDKKNKRTATYTTPPTPPRVGWSLECPLSPVAPDPSEEADLTGDTTGDIEEVVPSSQGPGTRDTPPEGVVDVPSKNPVVDSDLTQLGTNGVISDTEKCPQFSVSPETEDETASPAGGAVEGLEGAGGGEARPLPREREEDARGDRADGAGEALGGEKVTALDFKSLLSHQSWWDSYDTAFG